jgi:hypothetical protein
MYIITLLTRNREVVTDIRENVEKYCMNKLTCLCVWWVNTIVNFEKETKETSFNQLASFLCKGKISNKSNSIDKKNWIWERPTKIQ